MCLRAWNFIYYEIASGVIILPSEWGWKSATSSLSSSRSTFPPSSDLPLHHPFQSVRPSEGVAKNRLAPSSPSQPRSLSLKTSISAAKYLTSPTRSVWWGYCNIAQFEGIMQRPDRISPIPCNLTSGRHGSVPNNNGSQIMSLTVWTWMRRVPLQTQIFRVNKQITSMSNQ